MKQLFSQYAGLKKEIYILFIGKLVTAMGSFVWPMLTFFLTTKLGLSDGTSTLLIATAMLFVGMFVFTLGEVITVLGNNPYTSRRVPTSHRGRVGGIFTVVHSAFSSLTQYLISFLLIATQSNYKLLWAVFIVIGLVASSLYGFLYKPDKRTFPKLYQK